MKREPVYLTRAAQTCRRRILPLVQKVAHFHRVVDYIRDHRANGGAIRQWDRAAQTMQDFDPT